MLTIYQCIFLCSRYTSVYSHAHDIPVYDLVPNTYTAKSMSMYANIMLSNSSFIKATNSYSSVTKYDMVSPTKTVLFRN